MSLQEISESATRALELAEQRLAEAAAELQRRSVVLQDMSAEKEAALAKVRDTSPVVSGALYHSDGPQSEVRACKSIHAESHQSARGHQ